MAIFFLLFTVSFTARSFFVDRSQGMIERMRAAPIRPFEILAGKALSVFAYGVVSLATIAVITSAAFGANWGNPLAAVRPGLGPGLLRRVPHGSCDRRGPDPAPSRRVLVDRGLRPGPARVATSSSCLPSLPLMRHLALLTPNGWAMRGFTDLATIGGGLGTVVLPVAAILVFSAVVGTVAALLAPRAVTA